MTAADRDKWDRRYDDGAYRDRSHPTRLLEAHSGDFPIGRALDVACGAGRNALYLASLGFEVDAIDISEVALDRARESARGSSLRVEFRNADLTSGLPSSFGLGFIVGGLFAPFDQPGVFGHSGQQCAIAYGDPAHGLAVSYLTNGLHDPYVVQVRTEEMVWAILEACASAS